MKRWVGNCILVIIVGVVMSCQQSASSSLNKNEVNRLLAKVDEENPEFVKKGVKFDSIVTLVGQRELSGKVEKIKMKLFSFEGVLRGYYNLPQTDVKNLQVFGKVIDGWTVLKCVSNLETNDQGSYLIYDAQRNGVWASPHLNFKQGTIQLEKSATDYAQLVDW